MSGTHSSHNSALSSSKAPTQPCMEHGAGQPKSAPSTNSLTSHPSAQETWFQLSPVQEDSLSHNNPHRYKATPE